MTSSAKVIQFPLAGVARDQDYRKAYIPSEQASFATPFAINVTGECPITERLRGGSRPGLSNIGANSPTSTSDFRITWPNGDIMLWSGASRVEVTCASEYLKYSLADGTFVIPQHERFNLLVSKGALPSGSVALAMYRGRIIAAKDSVWYASRMAEVSDFDLGGDSEDSARAVAGNVARSMREGEVITTAASIGDNALVIATSRRLCVISGDVVGGVANTISEYTGIISRDAWCTDASGMFWFVGQNGLYAFAGESVQRASSRLPDDFKGLSSAVLAYDPERNGIYIFGTKSNVASDWYYDIDNKAIWKFSYNAQKRPLEAYTAVIGGVNRIVFKCTDGSWRRPNDSQVGDDGTAFQSKVAIGPIRTSTRDDMDGMIAEIESTLAAGSSNVTCEIYTARSPEGAVAAAENGSSADSYSLKAGWNNVVRTRKRGAWCVFVLSSNGRWGYESITAICKMLGRLR